MYKNEHSACFGCSPQTEPAMGEDTSMMETMALQDSRLKLSADLYLCWGESDQFSSTEMFSM